jgi:hypothetical protein
MSSNQRIGVDVWSGLLLVLFGAGGVWLALNLRLGTAISMGPGYFPLMIYCCIIALGLVIALRGLKTPGESFGWPLWRPLLVITAALLVFWLLVEPAGFVIASSALMLIAIKAQRHLNWFQAIIFTAISVLFTTLLFVIALKLPFPLWPSFG